MLTLYTFGDSILDCGWHNDVGLNPGQLLVRNDDRRFPEFRGRDLTARGPICLVHRAVDYTDHGEPLHPMNHANRLPAVWTSLDSVESTQSRSSTMLKGRHGAWRASCGVTKKDRLCNRCHMYDIRDVSHLLSVPELHLPRRQIIRNSGWELPHISAEFLLLRQLFMPGAIRIRLLGAEREKL